ncbi:D-alanyl-D-alanine carboxypeptidase family protein [Streptomyces sp. NPDC016309]|uniref:D-alanyl-D-alanine carboxypeptidase family protein n=1 Tax=Streptomyces sp. NPDC016309 TaxID=3364965 RepID=UPI0037010D82
MLTAAAGAVPAQAAAAPEGPVRAAPARQPSITAKGGFVMNAGTGAAVYAKGADGRLPTGSTAKIMTAEVVLARKGLDLDEKVTVQMAYSDYIVAKTASSARLIVGDKVTVRQLLYGLLLPSGCDAAYALADHFGTGRTRQDRVRSFVGRMNSTAKGLGLKNTHFDSFDGIGNGKNYSTPRDLATLAAKAMKNPTFRAIVKTRSTKQRVTTKNGGHRDMAWTNTNKLLGTYRGAVGVKTGSGPEAKYCLVFAATRGGRTLIGTVLASSSEANRNTDATKLLDHGFRN